MPFFRKANDIPEDTTLGDPRAARLVEAFTADDLDGVRDVLKAAGSPEERECLTSVLNTVERDPGVLDDWVEREPDDPDAWLARGAHGIGWAWAARGGGTADTVSEQAFELFFDRLREAEDDLLRAARMAPQDAVPWSHLIISGRGLQVPKEELWIRYGELQSRHPWLPEAHQQMLQGLCKKWSGSDEESLEFARRVHQEAPERAPARAVVAMAHVEIWLRLDAVLDEAYIRRPEVRGEILEAAQRSVLADGFTDDMIGVWPLNIFAFALHLAGEKATASALVQRLGPRRTDFPWYYEANGGRVYGKLLAA